MLVEFLFAVRMVDKVLVGPVAGGKEKASFLPAYALQEGTVP